MKHKKDTVKIKKKLKIIKSVGLYSITDLVLGAGSNSTVYLAVHQMSGKKYAIKYFTRDEYNLHSQFIEREASILKKLRNLDRVVHLENTFFDKTGSYFMVFELATSELKTFFEENGGMMEEWNIAQLFSEVAKGIKQLHDNRVAHGDIKLENVLIFKKEENGNPTYNVKISDLGYATFVDNESDNFLFSGSPVYAPPEIALGISHNSFKSDIWSLGIMLYVMLFNHFPFDINGSETLEILFRRIQEDEVSFNSIRIVSDECKDLITWMLNKDPRERPTIDQVLNHPWIIRNLFGLELIQSPN